MGRKAAAETVAKVLVAFIEQPTWKQAELARRCGVTVRAIRECLQDLVRANVPLSDDVEHPHVYWSIRRDWFKRVELQGVDVASIVRLVARLPKSNARDATLQRLTNQAFGIAEVTANASEQSADEQLLAELEEHRRDRVATRITYRSASRGKSESRCVSVQRIQYESPLRFVGHCHKSTTLKWFRIDRVQRACVASQNYASIDVAQVQQFIASGLDGFVGPRDAIVCEVFVGDAIARWATENLPPGAHPTVREVNGGRRITLRTSAIEVLARFIVGLGQHARVLQPPELRDAVRELANGALLNTDPVSAIAPTQIAQVKRSTVATVAAIPKRPPPKATKR